MDHEDAAANEAVRAKEKSEPWSRLLDGEMDFADEEDTLRREKLPLGTVSSSGSRHEGHFHRYGDVGILFVDAIGNRLRRQEAACLLH